jgi:hypothetical protein
MGQSEEKSLPGASGGLPILCAEQKVKKGELLLDGKNSIMAMVQIKKSTEVSS